MQPQPDPELEALVLGDLADLATGWKNPISEYTVKKESATLRRLLIDNGGTLQRYRRLKGLKGEPRIRAVDLRAALGTAYSRAVFAAAGGSVVGGVTLVLPHFIEGGPMEPLSVAFPTADYKLSDYLSSPSMVVDRTAVNRVQLIKYVANKLGGVHYDTKRKAEEKIFQLLDTRRKQLVILGIDLVHFEVLSIGQHLLRAPDIAILLPADLRFTEEIPDLDQVMNWVLQEQVSVPQPLGMNLRIHAGESPDTAPPSAKEAPIDREPE